MMKGHLIISKKLNNKVSIIYTQNTQYPQNKTTGCNFAYIANIAHKKNSSNLNFFCRLTLEKILISKNYTATTTWKNYAKMPI